MSNLINASFDTLFDQASENASVYLSRAHRQIDGEFGEGCAAKNPELVAAFMQVASGDFNASTCTKVYGAALEELSRSLSAIADSINQSGN